MTTDDQFRALEKKVEELSAQVGNLLDTQAVRDLQFKYGYYLDKCLYDEVVDLFTDDCEVHFIGGIFRGKESARRLYCGRFRKNFTGGHNGPVQGYLLDHMMLQDIIDISPDGKLAYARLRVFMQAGRHHEYTDETHPLRQWWEGSLYENVYAKENGIWKMKVLNYRPVYHADFDKGWAYTKPHYVPYYSDTYPTNPTGPDELEKPTPPLWPETDVLPFHYPHPVTGKEVKLSPPPNIIQKAAAK
jgi:carotenoid cleavage dioxygenase